MVNSVRDMTQLVALVADDDPGIRGIVAGALERLGFHVVASPDGEKAAAWALSQRHLDLLVTDIEMPGMTGPKLAARVRQAFPNVSTLFITGGATLLPGEQVLQKPFGIDELRVALRRMTCARPEA